MNRSGANELKKLGVVTIERALANQPEAIVPVHGKGRYVILDITHYQYLRGLSGPVRRGR